MLKAEGLLSAFTASALFREEAIVALRLVLSWTDLWHKRQKDAVLDVGPNSLSRQACVSVAAPPGPRLCRGDEAIARGAGPSPTAAEAAFVCMILYKGI